MLMEVVGDHRQRGMFWLSSVAWPTHDVFVFDDALVVVRKHSFIRLFTSSNRDGTSHKSEAAEALSPMLTSSEMTARVRGTKRIAFSEVTSVELKERRLLTRFPWLVGGPAATLSARSSTGTLLKGMVIGDDLDEANRLLRPVLGCRFHGLRR